MLVSLGNPWEGVYSAQELQARLHETKRSQGGMMDRVLRNAGAGTARTSTSIYRRGIYRR